MRINNLIYKAKFNSFKGEQDLKPSGMAQAELNEKEPMTAKLPTHALVYSAVTFALTVTAFFIGRKSIKK